MKLSIITPVYNEEHYLPGYLASIQSQTYQNWELILINDGSKDASAQIMDAAAAQDSRIICIHQPNQGQQVALLNGLKAITGEVVLLAHADDLLTGPNALAANMRYFEDDISLEGLVGDFIEMDAEGNETGLNTVPDTVDSQSVVRLMLRKGGNFLHDHFFCRRHVIETHILKNYFTWNMPYWVDFGEKRSTALKLLKTKTPWYRYRVYGQNYHTTPVGQFVMTNGCLRTVLHLSRHYHRIWPLYKWFKSFRERVVPGDSSWREKYRLVRGVMRVYYPEALPADIYHEAVLGFYHRKSTRVIRPAEPLHEDSVLRGKDAVAFYKQVSQDTIEPSYRWVLQEAKQGFGKLVVPSEQQKRIWEEVLYFLNLQARVVVG